MSKTAGVGEAAVKKRPADALRSPFLSVAGIAAWFLAVGLGLLSPQPARAEVDGISFEAGAAVPMGAPYLIYGRYPTFSGNVFLNSESLSPVWQLVGTFEMSVATINNTTVQQIRLWDYAVYAGIRYEQPPDEKGNGKGMRPYAQLQIGGIYDVMGLSGAASAIQNTGIDFGMRFTPGFELWASPKFGFDFGFPLEYLAVRDSLFIWNAIFGVRIKL